MNTLPKRMLGRTGLSVSEIGLGTTAIGYLYGLGHQELPSEAAAIVFLRQAVELGVNFIDTSPSYQLAEERIGKSGVAKMSGVIIGAKCGHVLDRGEVISDADLAKTMRQEIETSLNNIGLDHFELAQVHGGTAEQIRHGGIINAMQKLKDEDKVRFVGISLRGEAAALAAIESGFFDTIQLAYSILDQRMSSRVIDEAEKKNIGIINRSVLLKGALTSASAHLFPWLMSLKQNSDRAAVVAERLGLDLPTLAVRFVLSQSAISTALIGSNKIKHIKSAISAAKAGSLPEKVLTELNLLAIDDPRQVDPREWKTGAPDKFK